MATVRSRCRAPAPNPAKTLACTENVLESGPAIKVFSSANQPDSAPTTAVTNAMVMPKPTWDASGPENSNAP